jgi:RIO kinase 2
VKKTRDYLRSRTASYNWLHLSHLSALKEYAFMKALHTHGFPVPEAVDVNRHCVLMQLVRGVPLASLRELDRPEAAWQTAMDIMVRLAQHGLVHCDFNEFNLMVDDHPDGHEAITLIDFPQMVSAQHLNAPTYYSRDVACLQRFFVRRFDFRPLDAGLDDGSGGLRAALAANLQPVDANSAPEDASAARGNHATQLDATLRASGFGTREREQLEAGLAAVRAELDSAEGDHDERRLRGASSSSDDDEEEEVDEEDDEEDEEGAAASGAENEEGEGESGSDYGDDIPDACEPSQSALAAALLQRQRDLHVRGGADAGQQLEVEAFSGGDAPPSTAPPAVSVSVGLSARQCEVRERLRTERRRAGGARAAAAGGVRRTNYSKDKSWSHKKGSSGGADAVWG